MAEPVVTPQFPVIEDWIPKYIRTLLNYSTGDELTSVDLNNHFNKLITQGDYNAEKILELVSLLSDSVECTKVNNDNITINRIALALLRTEHDALYTDVQGVHSTIGDTKQLMTEDKSSMVNAVNNLNTTLRIYIDQTLTTIKDLLMNYTSYLIRDPTTGTRESVETVAVHLYDMFTVDAVTAAQFDAYELTFDELVAIDITAKDFDTRGRAIIDAWIADNR